MFVTLPKYNINDKFLIDYDKSSTVKINTNLITYYASDKAEKDGNTLYVLYINFLGDKGSYTLVFPDEEELKKYDDLLLSATASIVSDFNS